jgi:spore coat protein H
MTTQGLNSRNLNRRMFLALTGGLAAGAWAGGATSTDKKDKEREEFFKQGVIPRFEIEVSPKDMDSLRREPRKYVSATVKDGTGTYRNVGLHVKGAAGSFRGIDDKPALTLNANKFVDGQLIQGLDKFQLNNSVQDGTFLMEQLCAEMFHAEGVPVSFCTHATVVLNGKPRGFYVLKEGYDKGFLRRYFKNTKGNLYDGGFLTDLDADLHKLDGDDAVKDRKELKAVVRACAERDHAKRLARLEQLLDLEKFISLMALEVICWHWDGYAIKRNNYRVYHEPVSDKITIIPHGMDQMFGDINAPIQPGFDGMVAQALIQTRDGKLRYRERFVDLLRGRVLPAELSKRIDALEPKVRAVLATVDRDAAQSYPEHLRNLRAAIRQRADEAAKQVQRDWRMKV